MNLSVRVIALGVILAALAGCGGGSSSAGGGAPVADTTTTPTTSADANYTPSGVDAGQEVKQSTDVKPYFMKVLASAKYGHRADPFSLTPEEAAYDRQQEAERVMASMGGMRDLHEEKEEVIEVPPQEPQPYRRLAGIIVGDSVLALIDMGNGQLEVIRPGDKIGSTDWTVVSIDQDKAVLHRNGPVAPHTVTVRLESPPPGQLGGGGFNGGPTGQGGLGAPGGATGPGGPGGKRFGPSGD